MVGFPTHFRLEIIRPFPIDERGAAEEVAMKKIAAALAIIALLGASGCTNMNNTQQGAVTGGAIGGAVGIAATAIAGTSVLTGALVGAAVGGAAGAYTGCQKEGKCD